MHRQDLIRRLAAYRTAFLDEAAMVRRALAFIEAHPDCFSRSLRPGHVTGSAWVVNARYDHVLLMHHRKLDRWLQPGGHADGDADIIRVALRETAEEAGVDPGQLRLVSEMPFDVDIHAVTPTESDPTTQHIDVRFLVEMDDRIPVPGNAESYEVRWVPLHQVPRYNNDRSAYRMLEKTRTRARPR